LVTVLLGLLLGLSACDPAREPPAPGSAGTIPGSTLPLEAATEHGRYRIRARPASPPIVLHRMHDWIVGVEGLQGPPQPPVTLRLDGGMPAHGHGFVTRPRVTENLGQGEFRIEGVKFHMPGAWVLQVTVTDRRGSDQVTLPLTLAP
jgi:hypothetical protein